MFQKACVQLQANRFEIKYINPGHTRSAVRYQEAGLWKLSRHPELWQRLNNDMPFYAATAGIQRLAFIVDER